VLGSFRCLGHPLEEDGADERSPHGSGGAIPRDRRASVQERATLKSEPLAGGRDIDEQGARRHEPSYCLGVGLDAAWVGVHPAQRLTGARHRRTPINHDDGDCLLP
jgi:hypothetical protein